MVELIEHGADVNYVSEAEKRTQTPLFWARNYQAVKFILQKGADPNLYSKLGSNRKIKAVDHLLENNQDAARAIFDENLNVDDEENLIMDLEIFENEYSDKTDGEMSILVKAEKKSSLDIPRWWKDEEILDFASIGSNFSQPQIQNNSMAIQIAISLPNCPCDHFNLDWCTISSVHCLWNYN